MRKVFGAGAFGRALAVSGRWLRIDMLLGRVFGGAWARGSRGG